MKGILSLIGLCVVIKYVCKGVAAEMEQNAEEKKRNNQTVNAETK